MNNICIYGVSEQINTEDVIRTARHKGLSSVTIDQDSGELHHYKVSIPPSNLSYKDALDLVIYFRGIPGATDIKLQKKHESKNSTPRY